MIRGAEKANGLNEWKKLTNRWIEKERKRARVKGQSLLAMDIEDVHVILVERLSRNDDEIITHVQV